MATVDDVIEQSLQDVLRRLAQLTVAEPAYAVGLAASPGNESLAVELVAVGIGRDRTKWAGKVDAGEAVFQSWNPYEFSVQEPLSASPQTDEAFEAAEAQVHAELFDLGIEDPQRYVYNRVAAKLDPTRLEFPVTEDFISFAFLGPDHLETDENMRFSASPKALAILDGKRLLMRNETFPGLDVILSTAIDEHRHAGLVLRDDMILGSAHLPSIDDAWPVHGGATVLGDSPKVLAGGLPRGAVSAEVRDRKGVWHAALTVPGLWLCVLPQGSGQNDPKVRFRDLVGQPPPQHEDEFSAGVPEEDPPDAIRAQAAGVLARAVVPALWPRQVSAGPDVYAWEGEADAATALGLAGGGHRVWIASSAPDLRQTFEQHLVRDWSYGVETAAARSQQVPITALEGSIDGTPLNLKLAAPQEPWMRSEGWAAIAETSGYAITITGYDEPPARLDFDKLA